MTCQAVSPEGLTVFFFGKAERLRKAFLLAVEGVYIYIH